MPDARHARRIALFQELFSASFHRQPDSATPAEHSEAVSQILANLTTIDTRIQKQALERPIANINKVDLAILRLVVFESDHTKTPKKVLLDEAVRLAKEFGSENSSKFVNGVLAQILLGDSQVA